jgi:hypothetical protein
MPGRLRINTNLTQKVQFTEVVCMRERALIIKVTKQVVHSRCYGFMAEMEDGNKNENG